MTAQTSFKARAFRAVASRLSAAASRCRNPERKAELLKAASTAAKSAVRVERGTYKAPVPPVTPRTGAALAAHLTRTEKALARVRNADNRKALQAKARAISARLEQVQA